MNKRYLPLKKALFWIFMSMVITSILGGGVVVAYRQILKVRSHDSTYDISILLQTGPKKEALSSSYLAEVMDLAGDVKTNLYQFNTRLAEAKLISSPLIKRVHITKIFPNTLFVDYAARMPKALLCDYPNTAIDEEGYIFPLLPFFTPKRLPEIYLGLMPFGYSEDELGSRGGMWNLPLASQEVELALAIIDIFSQTIDSQLLRVDVASAYSDSWGRREVVLVIHDIEYRTVEDKMTTLIFPRILRLSTKNYAKDLEKYRTIRHYLIEEALAEVDLELLKNSYKAPGLIVDLRIQDLAYVH